MKKFLIDKGEKEVDSWKLKVLKKTSKMSEEEKEKFLKAEAERIKKTYNFKFVTSTKQYDYKNDFSVGMVCEKSSKYGKKKNSKELK